MQAPLIMSYHAELKARLGVIVANNDEFYALVCTPSIKWISVTPVDSSRLSIVQSAYVHFHGCNAPHVLWVSFLLMRIKIPRHSSPLATTAFVRPSLYDNDFSGSRTLQVETLELKEQSATITSDYTGEIIAD